MQTSIFRTALPTQMQRGYTVKTLHLSRPSRVCEGKCSVKELRAPGHSPCEL